MPLRAHHATIHAVSHCDWLGHWAMGLLALVALANPAVARDTNAQVGPSAITVSPVLPPIATPKWTDLQENERQILQPLAAVWDDMSTTRRKKWRSIARTYAQLSLADQTKISQRMGEWALLSTKERQLARLNFAQSNNLNPQELASNWQAYQSLNETERKALAERTSALPAGAAIAPKPIPKEKLATIAVTRHSTDVERATASALQPIDRKTLLPLRPAPLEKLVPHGGT